MKRASSAIGVIVILASAAAHAAVLSAQEPVRPPSRFIPHVSVAGGFDARNDGNGDPEMYFGLATLEWTTRVSGLSLRLDGIYANRDRISHMEAPCITCDRVGHDLAFLSSKVTGAGAMVGATYALLRHEAFRPYVFGSGGIVLTHDKLSAGTVTFPLCATEACAMSTIGQPAAQQNNRATRPAAQLGAGLVYSWSWVSVLAEARYVAVDYTNPRGLNGAVPISLGLRF